MKWKVYKMILRPAVIGGLETVDLEVAELKMLKFSVTKTVRKEGKANISIQTLSFVLFVVSFPLFSALLRVSSH